MHILFSLRYITITISSLAFTVLLSTVASGQDLTEPEFPTEQPITQLQQPDANNAPKVRQLGNVKDDIGFQLQESDRQIDSLFSAGFLVPLNNAWENFAKRLNESRNLDVGMNYTALFQRADTSVSGPRDAGGGDYDFFGNWLLWGEEGNNPGSLVFNSESRHRYDAIAPADLDTGTLGGTVVGFGTQDFSLIQLYWEQGSYEDGYICRVGRMDPALIYDGGRYVSSNYAFLSPAFSDTLPMPLPGTGLGLAGAIYPTSDTYIVAGLHDANGSRTQAGWDTFFGDGEYFTAVEFGYFPNENRPDEGLFHCTLWNIDARENASRQSDHGIALTLEQQLGCKGNLVPFVRYAYANRGINGTRQNLSLGLGIEEIFNQNHDEIGIAWSWARPTNQTLRDQFTFESFYKIYITPNSHITPDLQVIINPANTPTKSAVTILGLRWRTLF